MSVGVIVMNKRGVGLAADSAATLISQSSEFGGQGFKVFYTANKIHPLSDVAPVAVVHAGGGEFMGFPWETAFAFYRRTHGTGKFPTLREYGTHFLNFLAVNSHFSRAERQRNFVVNTMHECLQELSGDILKKTRDQRRAHRNSDAERDRQITRSTVENEWKHCVGIQELEGLSTEHYVKTFEEQFGAIFKQLHELVCWKDRAEKIFGCGKKAEYDSLEPLVWEIVLARFMRKPDPARDFSGSQITLVGYGEEEEFPSCIEYRVEGIANGVLKSCEKQCLPVNFDDDAIIHVVGQPDVVDRVLYGVDKAVLREIFKDFLSQAFPRMAQDIADRAPSLSESEKKQIVEYYRGGDDGDAMEMAYQFAVQYSDERMTEVVALLSLTDLENIAEKMADLTSWYRQFSTDRPTVGGPIDVASLSKDRGFEWVKQKT